MVADVPTFRSNATTQIPSMGIVSQSGTRAMGEGFARVGNFFDVVADYNNKKLDQKMQRDMTRMGQEIASQKGFDPDTLNTDPITAADQILRESALNTYAITLESDIENSINTAHVKNLRNPEGFKAVTDKYIEKTVASTPWELRNGVSKLATGMANSKYAGIKMETARRAIAETEAAEKKFLDNLADKAVLAKSPEEREIAINKIQSMLDNSTAYMTQAGRNAAKAELVQKIFTEAEMQEVMVGNVSPLQALERLKANGVVTDSTTLNNFYSVANQKIRFEEALEQRTEKAREKTVQKISEQFLLDAYDTKMAGGEPETFDEIMRLSAQTMREHGASVQEIQKHNEVIRATIYGDGKDNPQAVTVIDELIFNADPNGMETIDKMFSNGMINAATRQKKVEEYTKATSDIIKNPIIDKYLNTEFVPSFAPLANIRAEEADILSQSGASNLTKAQIASDKAELLSIQDRIIDLSNSGKNASEIAQILRQERSAQPKVPVEVKAELSAGKPHYTEMQSLLSGNTFTLKKISPSGQTIMTEIDDKPWSNQNYRDRLKMMIQENQKAQQLELTVPYNEQLIKDIHNAFGTN